MATNESSLQSVKFIEDLKRKWMALVDGIVDPTMFLDANYKIIKVNRALAELTQTPIKSLLGNVCYQTLAGRDAPCPGCQMLQVVSTQKPITFELDQIIHKKFYEVLSQPIFEENNALEGVLHIYRDRTEQKNNERIRETEENLMQSAKLAAIGTLAASIAHELANPLTFVQGYGEKLIRDAGGQGDFHSLDPAEIKKIGEDIVGATRRMIALVSHLRQFTRKSTATDWKRLDVNDVIKDALIILEHRIKVKKIKMTLDLSGSLPEIWGDPNQLESIFQNLIVNSIDAFENHDEFDNRQIFITTHSEADGALIWYRDNAGGMPEEVKERIFEPFYTTKPKGKGTGLGLSISKGIVDQHKGRISVETKRLIGTTFELFFPMVGPDKDSQKEECAKAQPLTRFADKRCVLVIHEDEKMCGMLTACLSEHFAVKTVMQPTCALKDVREIIFDVILCNFIMPEISGLDIAQAAKQAQPQTPVIILSNTEWNEKSLRNAMRNGVADIVKTPIENMQALLTKVLAILKK